MKPLVVDFGTWNLPLFGQTHVFIASYGVLFALAALTGWILFLRLARRDGLPEGATDRFAFWTVVAGLLGSKLTLLALDWRYYWDDPSRLLSTFRSAGVLMGGIGAAVVAAIFLTRRFELPFWRVADAAAVPLPLSQAIGRIGCFLAGCCFGRACDLPWAVTFHDPFAAEYSGVPLGVPLHPTQLYHAGADLVVFGLVLAAWRRRRVPGQVFVAYLVFYAVDRFIVEMWRGDTVRGVFLGGISTSQILSLVAFAGGLILWFLLARRAPGPAGATAPATGRGHGL